MVPLLLRLKWSKVIVLFDNKNWEAKKHIGTYEYHNGPSGQVGLDLYANPLETHLTNAKEITFSYRLMFSENYEAVKGGKLPGLCAFFFIKLHHLIFSQSHRWW